MDPAPDAGQLRDDAVETRHPALGHQNLEHDLNHRHQHHHTGPVSLPIQSQTDSRPESLPYTDSDLTSDNQDDGLSYHQVDIPDSYSTTTYHDPLVSTENNHHVPSPSIDPDDFFKKTVVA